MLGLLKPTFLEALYAEEAQLRRRLGTISELIRDYSKDIPKEDNSLNAKFTNPIQDG